MTTDTRPHGGLVRIAVLAVVAAMLVVAGGVTPTARSLDAADESTVRLLTIGATRTGGMLDALIGQFETESGYEVEIIGAGPDIMDRARRAEGDLAMVHLGYTPLHDFVQARRGDFPATVMSNTVAFLVPPGDPAGVGSTDDPVEAFEAIADAEAPFVVNNLGETLFISNTLYEAAGRPDPGDWLIDLGQSGVPAVREAEGRGGYTIWGLHPFLMLRQQEGVDLAPVVFTDSLLQRIIATTVVQRPPGRVNEEGARALQEFLIRPSTQAEIRAFRLPGISGPVFWPAANQNDN